MEQGGVRAGRLPAQQEPSPSAFTKGTVQQTPSVASTPRIQAPNNCICLTLEGFVGLAALGIGNQRGRVAAQLGGNACRHHALHRRGCRLCSGLCGDTGSLLQQHPTTLLPSSTSSHDLQMQCPPATPGKSSVPQLRTCTSSKARSASPCSAARRAMAV